MLTEVAQELVRRRRWDEAVGYLERGLGPSPNARAQHLLARGLYEVGRVRDAIAALEQVDTHAATSPEACRLLILSLERIGRLDAARRLADAYAATDPHDVVVQSVLERIAAPVPEGGQRGADPFYTVERAERYAQSGRVDRAIRTYRRILMYHQHDQGLASRLRQLSASATRAEDDLSEELVDPALVPPEPLSMPEPQITPTPLAATPRIEMRVGDDVSEDGEVTDTIVRTSGSGA